VPSEGKIDFKSIAVAALASADRLVPQWCPDGRREGHEWKARNPTRADHSAGSFSINLNTGVWADFATDDRGGDLISLYAYLFDVAQVFAAHELAVMLGISQGEVVERQLTQHPPVLLQEKRTTPWAPIMPVPSDAPSPPVAHIKRGKPQMSWRYLDADGRLLGLIMRFATSNGGKEIIPFTYCRHSETGETEWRPISFPKPRPLYGLDRLAQCGRESVLIVEGEKCADVANALFDTGVAVSWPGGAKAIDKVDWSPLAGRKVVLWPDADSQREKAPKDVPPGTVMPYLPGNKQPGMAAMIDIADRLMQLNCVVFIIQLPPPGTLADGWDIADAVQKDGWDAERVRKFMRDNLAQTLPPAESISTPTNANAEEPDPREWKRGLLRGDNGELRGCRENVFLILEQHPDWRGVIVLDEFANTIMKRKEPPFMHGKVGEWDTTDDARLGLWLATTKGIRMPVRSLDAISEAVNLVAHNHVVHPVREYLDSLEWDGISRIDHWMVDFLGAVDKDYVRLVSRFFLIGMVARIYKPGCKMDYMPILEGLQGKGKSSALRVLGGRWFSDTPFDMKSKDSYVALPGKWLYEIGELDSFNRAESTTAKTFIASMEDNYRAPYERRNRKHKRQCVFAGTTNQDEYFKDQSGNRRYWPIRVGEINIPGLKSVRDQLFAEAVALFRAGERWYPTRDEDVQLFAPEQEEREINDPWFGIVREWLCKESAAEFTSADILLGCLRFEMSKIGPARQEATRVGNIMKKLGWTKHRRSTGDREWFYRRPQKPQPEKTPDGQEPF
jgi:putative DNA primase/helicase